MGCDVILLFIYVKIGFECCIFVAISCCSYCCWYYFFNHHTYMTPQILFKISFIQNLGIHHFGSRSLTLHHEVWWWMNQELILVVVFILEREKGGIVRINERREKNFFSCLHFTTHSQIQTLRSNWNNSKLISASAYFIIFFISFSLFAILNSLKLNYYDNNTIMLLPQLSLLPP